MTTFSFQCWNSSPLSYDYTTSVMTWWFFFPKYTRTDIFKTRHWVCFMSSESDLYTALVIVVTVIRDCILNDRNQEFNTLKLWIPGGKKSIFTVVIQWISDFCQFAWWRHQMETFSALLALCAGNSPVTSEFPSQRPLTRSFDVFFHLSMNKRLSKQLWGWWFEMASHSLWRHRNVCVQVQSMNMMSQYQ